MSDLKIARVFLDVDMRMAFPGMRDLLRKKKVTPKLMGKGDICVFINKAGTAFKVLAGNDYIAYYNHRKRIPLEAIQHLPSFFGGNSFEFSKAIEKTILDKVGPK